MRFKLLIILQLLIIWHSKSQNFLYQAALPIVDSSGFYNIYIPPTITSKLNSKFSDLRLFDKKNREIPYIFENFNIDKNIENISEMEITENQHRKLKKFTNVVVENTSKSTIENILLLIDKPKATECWISIFGSDDQINWFVIKNNVRFQIEKSDSSKTHIYANDLKSSNFKFYRITIFDNNKISFNVNKVFCFKSKKTNVQLIKLPDPTFSQDDSTERGKTIVKVHFNEPQYVDKLVFTITEPNIFYRKADISQKDSVTGRKIHLQFFNNNQKEFYFNSDTTNELHLQRFYARDFIITVYNNDNIPLKFSKIEAYQVKNYIIAYLKAGQKYRLFFGNHNITNPVYDLKYFTDKISTIRHEIEPIEIQSVVSVQQNIKSVYIAKTILWITFFLIVAFLVIISIKIFSKSQKQPYDENII